MRVVADSHAVYWYVVSPDRLSERALDTLTAAETTDGIAVPAVTMPDLWMAATRRRGARALPRSGYDLLRAALLDPRTALDVTPLDATAWGHFEALPPSIADPMDGLIVATALALGLPLVPGRPHHRRRDRRRRLVAHPLVAGRSKVTPDGEV